MMPASIIVIYFGSKLRVPMTISSKKFFSYLSISSFSGWHILLWKWCVENREIVQKMGKIATGFPPKLTFSPNTAGVSPVSAKKCKKLGKWNQIEAKIWHSINQKLQSLRWENSWTWVCPRNFCCWKQSINYVKNENESKSGGDDKNVWQWKERQGQKYWQ